jgi:hypothetical protein
MSTTSVASIVLSVFIVWALAVMFLAFRPGLPRSAFWLLLLPSVLVLRGNPFASETTAAVFVVCVWAIDVMCGLSFPLLWVFGHLNGVLLAVSVVMLALPSLMKGALPGQRWLGIALATLLGPWGHWYREGGGRGVIGTWALALVIGLATQLVWLHWRAANTDRHVLDLPELWLRWPGAGLRAVSGLIMGYLLTRD